MIYLLESRLPETKPVFVALKSVYGFGKYRSKVICKKLGFSQNLKVKDLSPRQISKITRLCDSLNFVLASDLKKFNLLNYHKLVAIKSYRGLRKRKGFPVRGQRTHTNAKTSKKKLGFF